MNTKVTRFLVVRFVLMVMVCVVVFFALMQYVSLKTETAVNEITDIYISEINEQIKQKFSVISQLRINQVAAVVKRAANGDDTELEKSRDNIRLSAEVRGFNWLGLYIGENRFESIYGEDIDIPDDSLRASLNDNGEVITYG